MRLIFFLAASAILTIFTLFPGARCEEDGAPAIGVRPFSLTDLSHYGSRLKDPDIAKVAKAARELGESGQPAAAPLLLTLYTDGDGERRFEAVKALGVLKEVTASNKLNPNEWTAKKRAETFQAVALGDLSIAIRRAAAYELARAERLDAAMKFFMEAAGNAKAFTPLYRNRALHHVARLGGLRAEGFLREALASPEPELATAAAEELGEMPELPNADALILALGSKLPEVKAAARAALERMSGKSFQFDLVKWSEWRASLSSSGAKEIFTPS
jgi:HEAT repeat protein